MNRREITKIAKLFNGWFEGDDLRFPSVHQKDQFLKAVQANQAVKRAVTAPSRQQDMWG